MYPTIHRYDQKKPKKIQFQSFFFHKAAKMVLPINSYPNFQYVDDLATSAIEPKLLGRLFSRTVSLIPSVHPCL